MLNLIFLFGSSSFVSDKNLCAGVAVSLHYLVLSSLSWMCVEATNMYQLLVHVFATAESHFLLKRSAVAWGKIFNILKLNTFFLLHFFLLLFIWNSER